MSRCETGPRLFVDRIRAHHLYYQREHGSAVAALDGLVDDGPAGSRVDASVSGTPWRYSRRRSTFAVGDRLPEVALDASAEEWCSQMPVLAGARRQCLLK